MNQTNCPSGMLTDQFLMLGEPLDRCDIQSALYIGLVVIVLVLHFTIAVGQTHLWVRRERRRRADSKAKATLVFGRKLPVVPALSWLIMISICITFGLCTENVANTMNGGTTFLLGIIVFMYCIEALLYTLKFISLGKSIVRSRGGKLARQSIKTQAEGQDAQHSSAQIHISVKFAVILSVVALSGLFISFCVFGLVFPNTYSVAQAGFGFLSVFVAIIVTTLLNHIQRIKGSIKESARSTNDMNISPEAKVELARVLSKLTEHQVSLSLVGLPMFLWFALIAGKVIVAHFYVAVICALLIQVMMLGFVLSNYFYIFRKGGKGKQSQHDENRTSKGADETTSYRGAASFAKVQSSPGLVGSGEELAIPTAIEAVA